MLKCSVLFIMKEIIIFMTACKLVIGNYKGLYNANIWMSAALWGISGNEAMGYSWTWEQCRTKIKNLTQNYRKVFVTIV